MSTWIWSVLLLLVALAIVAIELVVPTAGLLPVLSIAAAMGGVLLGFMVSFQFGMIMLIVSCILIPAVLIALLQVWPHTPMGRQLVIQAPQSDDILPNLDEERHLKSLIGHRGFAKTKMLPSGIVEIDGVQYDANSDGMPIDNKQAVQVVAVKMHRLEVRAVGASEPLPPPKQISTTDDILSRPIDSLGLESIDDPLA